MMTPPLACVASEERMPDCRAESRDPKEEDELRLDSWIQIGQRNEAKESVEV